MKTWAVWGCSLSGYAEELSIHRNLWNALQAAAAWQHFCDTSPRGLRGRVYTVVEVTP